MKNKKIKQLMERGLSHKLLLTMNEGQINQLHKMMVSEITMVPKTDTATIDKLKNEKKPFEVYEQGVEVDKSDSKLGQTTQEPHQVQAPDGMDDEGDDGIDKEEDISEAKKKSKYNPYAICTSSVGRDDKKKFERCVMDVKRNIKEGKNPYLPIVESSLLKMVVDSSPATAVAAAATTAPAAPNPKIFAPALIAAVVSNTPAEATLPTDVLLATFPPILVKARPTPVNPPATAAVGTAFSDLLAAGGRSTVPAFMSGGDIA